MDRSFAEENAKELKRLRSFVERLSDDEPSLPVGNDWTVSFALAHLAFWDHRSLVLIRKWKLHGVEPSPIDVDVTNESLLPTWLALPPRIAANLAVAAAEAVDSELSECPPEFISEIDGMGDKFRLFRSVHRKLHLDQIEESLQSH
jgi:hypothetical protein